MVHSRCDSSESRNHCQVVLSEDDATVVARVAHLLQGLGETRILSGDAHRRQVDADQALRAAKERQAAGLATGKECVEVVRELTQLRGQGGPERKRIWAACDSCESESLLFCSLSVLS